MRDDGLAVLFISSEIEEVVRNCGRAIVLRERRQAGEVAGADLNGGTLMRLMAGTPAAAGEVPPMSRPAPRLRPRARPRPVGGIAALLALNLCLSPRFLQLTVHAGHLYGGPVDILSEGSRACLVALGMTLVIATGGVDLSVGSVMAMAGSAAALAFTQGHAALPAALAGAVGVGLAAGLLNGARVAYAGIQPIVATLVLMVAGRGISQLITDGQVIAFQNGGAEYLGTGFLLGLPFSALLVGLLDVLTDVGLRRTAAGLFIEAVGDNETASRFAGLRAARVKGLAYVACGACAGLAGFLDVANIRSADPYRAGENMELNAIFAVVVGGTALSGGRFLILAPWPAPCCSRPSPPRCTTWECRPPSHRCPKRW